MSERLVSGQLGNPAYEIDCLPVPGAPGFAVRVQLRRDAAEELVRWHRPDIGAAPIREVPEFDDSDAFCDAVIDAVRAWVETFPLRRADGGTA